MPIKPACTDLHTRSKYKEDLYEVEEEDSSEEESLFEINVTAGSKTGRKYPVVTHQGSGRTVDDPIEPSDDVLPMDWTQYKKCHEYGLWGHISSYKRVRYQRKALKVPADN